MNHNPIPTDKMTLQMLKVVPLSEVLEAIGHPAMGDDGTDAFSAISFGDAAYTLCSGWMLFRMIDQHLTSEDRDGTYTDAQSDRIQECLYSLADNNILIDMEG